MDTVFERRGKQIGPVLRKRREQQHGILNVGDGVRARVLKGQHAAGLLGRQRSVGTASNSGHFPFGFTSTTCACT